MKPSLPVDSHLPNGLTAPANPLTARVTVNRYWQMIFGTGLVKRPRILVHKVTTRPTPELLTGLPQNLLNRNGMSDS